MLADQYAIRESINDGMNEFVNDVIDGKKFDIIAQYRYKDHHTHVLIKTFYECELFEFSQSHNVIRFRAQKHGRIEMCEYQYKEMKFNDDECVGFIHYFDEFNTSKSISSIDIIIDGIHKYHFEYHFTLSGMEEKIDMTPYFNLKDKKAEEDCSTYVKDRRIVGLVEVRTIKEFNPDKLVIGNPYKITFTDGIEIFGRSINKGESVYGILCESSRDRLVFVTNNAVMEDENDNSWQPFILSPCINFTLEYLE